MLNVVSWNVDGWHTINKEQLQLLDRADADVALLQEVTPASLELLRDDGWIGTSSLELVGDGHTERGGASPRFGCAVLARGDTTILSAELVAQAPSPVRAIQARLRISGQDIQAFSAALPPGSMWGRRAKVGQADTIARAITAAGVPTLVGMDRNGPRFERWDPAETEWWREGPGDFFGDSAAHGCVDVLDRWHADVPGAAKRARAARPNGPRAVSYVEQRAKPPIERRYDIILASPTFDVLDVRYAYQAAVEAGSDHGLVKATLALDTREAVPAL